MIHNANSCGQGYDPEHADNPYHDLVTDTGYVYSHTTPVYFPNRERVEHHTYKLGQRNVAVYHRIAANGWVWESSPSSGSGRSVHGKSVESLQKHLKNVVRNGKPRASRAKR